MAFTAQLGTQQAAFAQIELGGLVGPIDVSASNMLSFSQVGENIPIFVSQLGSRLAMLANIELAAAEVNLLGLSNTFVISQTVRVSPLILTATNILAFSQVIVVSSLKQSVPQTFVISSAATETALLKVSASNLLRLLSVGEGEALQPGTNTLTFSQDAEYTKSKGAANNLTFAQDLERFYLHSGFPTNTLVFTQVVNVGSLKSASNTLVFSQIVSPGPQHLGSAANLFVMTANAVGFSVHRASNTLSLSDSATNGKITQPNIAQSLTFTGQVAVNVVLGRSLTDNFVFTHGYNQQTQIQGIFLTTFIPEVIWTIAENRVIYRTSERAIILLPPNLMDGEAGSSKITLHRTITGGTYVYCRRTTTRLLKYSFETDTFKALEMRRFMLDFLSTPVYLENWKGELWLGYFTSNPIELKTTGRGAIAGDRYMFDVEFEGARIH